MKNILYLLKILTSVFQIKASLLNNISFINQDEIFNIANAACYQDSYNEDLKKINNIFLIKESKILKNDIVNNDIEPQLQKKFFKIKELKEIINLLNKIGGENLINLFLNLNKDKINIISRIDGLYYIIKTLSESGKQNLIIEFFNLNSQKLEQISNNPRFQYVIYELCRIGGHALISEFFDFDIKKLEALSKIDRPDAVLAFLYDSGGENLLRIFLNFESSIINEFSCISYLHNILYELNQIGGQEVVSMFINMDSDLIKSYCSFSNLNYFLNNLNTKDLLLRFFNLKEVIQELFRSQNLLSISDELSRLNLLEKFFLILEKNNLNFIKNTLFKKNNELQESEYIAQFIDNYK